MMKKHIYLCLVSCLVSCKPTEIIFGVAQNAKDGKIIRSEGKVYIIDSKEFSWNDSILNKDIEAKVKILSIANASQSDLGYDTGLYQQGRLGENISVKILNIKIIQTNNQ